MTQFPRGLRSGAGNRSSRRVTTFALIGATAIALAIFAVLQRTDPPPSGGGPTIASATLLVVGRTADGTPVRALRGALRGPGTTTEVVGHARSDGALAFVHAGTGVAALELFAPGLTRVRKEVLLSGGERTLTILFVPGSRLNVRVTDDLGEPIPAVDVDVWETSTESLEVTFDTWKGSTDVAGEVVIEGLPLTAISVAAGAPGHEAVTLTEIDPTRSDTVTVVLQRTARIEGHLIYKSDRTAAAGTVVIAGSGVWPPRRLEVGASGNFAIEGLPGGVYELHASAPGWVAEPVEGVTIGPGETGDATLLLAAAVQMRVRVVDAQTGKPIADAQVQVGESSLAFSAATLATNVAGEVTIEGLRPHSYRLSILADGYVPLTWVEQAPAATVVTHSLIAAAEIRGQVVDADGRPVAGASLEVTGDASDGIPVTMTRGSLAFRAQLLRGVGMGPLPLTRSDNLGVTVGAVPRIPLAAMFARPAADADNATTALALMGFTTDTSGRFSVTGVPPGTVQLVVAQPGWAIARSAVIRVAAGARINNVRIALERGSRVSGTVSDSRGFPLAAIRVELECEGDPTPRSTLSDNDGRYSLVGALGTCVVTATPRDLPAARASVVAAGEDSITVDLAIAAEAVRFQCSVVDSGDFPVVGAAVRVQGVDPAQPTSAAGLSRADGSVELDGLGPPPYRIEISHPAFASLVLAPVVETAGARFTLLAGTVIRGTVLAAADRAPLSGARVELRSGANGAPRFTRSGSLGLFEIRHVTSGNYELIAIYPQMLSTPRELVVSKRDIDRGEVDAGEFSLAAAGSVSGTVIDRLGVPVGGARVSSGVSSATTDREGAFRLAGLTPGMVEVTAAHAGAGRATKLVTARVFAGVDTPGLRLQVEGRYVPEQGATDEAMGTTNTAGAPDRVVGGTPRVGVAVEVATVHGAVEVAQVLPDSHAERAGMKPGDVIRSIDGEPVVIAGQARSLLRGEVNAVATLDLTRGHRRMRLQVRRERFVLPVPP